MGELTTHGFFLFLFFVAVSWFLDNVTVTVEGFAAPFVFPCNRWLASVRA